MKDRIKILLLGDEGVGKSSLMSSYISRHFPQEVPAVMTDAVIPPAATSNNVCVTIMDSSARPGDRDVLRQKILLADSIIVLYDATRAETFESLSQEWLPLIKEVTSRHDPENNKPVILIGTKIDLLVDEDNDVEKLHVVLTKYPNVLLCSQCSAAKLLDVDEVFYFGEMVVTFPLSPIFDVVSQEFTPAFRRAFLRIFRIFDEDGDGLLSDTELCETELRCFDGSINAEELRAIKKQIATAVVGGLKNEKITFEGFLGLIKMMLDKHKYEIPWTILRQFDYDDDLNISIPAKVASGPRVAGDQITQLSNCATEFLQCMLQSAYEECEKPLASAMSDLSAISVQHATDPNAVSSAHFQR